MGPPKSVVLICLNVMPYTFLRPIAQYLFVAQSGGAPKTNELAIVLPPPPPDVPLPHAATSSASESTAAPRAYLRYFRMGLSSPPDRGGSSPLDMNSRTLSGSRDGPASNDRTRYLL